MCVCVCVYIYIYVSTCFCLGSFDELPIRQGHQRAVDLLRAVGAH